MPSPPAQATPCASASPGPAASAKGSCLLMHLNDEKLLAEPGVRVALATALYKDESLSLGRAAKLAGMVLVEFMQHVSRLGIPVVRGAAATVRQDANNLKAWLKK